MNRLKKITWNKIVVLLLCIALAVSCSGCLFLLDDFFEEDESTIETTSSIIQAETNIDDNKVHQGSLANGTQSSASASGKFTENMVRNKLTNTDTANSATVLVYMNGSNLESDDGEATQDLSEMVNATHSDSVNILVQTMGTKKWSSTYGISSKKTQRFKVSDYGLDLVDDSLSQLDCTEAATLLDFIQWGTTNYPADRYILVFWNHGGGPVYGFGLDEWNRDDSATLTIDEIQLAITQSNVSFDFIGMDCCIMSCLETCMAFYGSADYAILSEEFESGMGWSYSGWMSALANNPSINTEELAKIIIDDMVSANETSREGDSSTLACIDESMIKVLYNSWLEFAYANEEQLLASNFSTLKKGGSRSLKHRGDTDLEDYYITDLMALAENINSAQSYALASAMNNAMVYYRETADESTMTGMAITLPYGDMNFYNEMARVFRNCGIDEEYIVWLEKFVSAGGYNSFFDYDDWNDQWSGWDDYEDDFNWSNWYLFDDADCDDNYWSDDEYGWDDYDISDYWDTDWFDNYWDNYYDEDYWWDWDSNDDYYYDDDYGYYNWDDDTWYEDWDSWLDDFLNDW